MTGDLDSSNDVEAHLLAAELEIGKLREQLNAAQERERLLSFELQHRVRNMLAVIRSICRRSIESGASQEEFAQHFQGRLETIARYQTEMNDFGSAGTELEDVVRNELLRVHAREGEDLTIMGPPVRLMGRSLDLLNLTIHELTTNAVKFGALYHGGSLHVSWVLDHADRSSLIFRWTETSVPLISPAPRLKGFGQQLVEEALPYQLGATTSFELRPGGLVCVIALPLCAIDDATAADTSTPIYQLVIPEAEEQI